MKWPWRNSNVCCLCVAPIKTGKWKLDPKEKWSAVFGSPALEASLKDLIRSGRRVQGLGRHLDKMIDTVGILIRDGARPQHKSNRIGFDLPACA